MHTQYNSYVRQAMRSMEKNRVLLDYPYTVIDCVRSAGVREMYAPLTEEWAQNLLCPWNSFYASIPGRSLRKYRVAYGGEGARCSALL